MLLWMGRGHAGMRSRRMWPAVEILIRVTGRSPAGRARSLRQVATSVIPTHVRHSNLPDLAEEVAEAAVVEVIAEGVVLAVAADHVAVDPGEDAELRLVLPVIDEPPSVGTPHSPDRTAVEEQAVQVVRGPVLPGDMVPFGVADAGGGGVAHDPLRPLPGMQVFQRLLRPIAEEMHADRHAPVR